MKFKDVVKACMGGVLLAGIIMGLASAGLLGALSTLFSVGGETKTVFWQRTTIDNGILPLSMLK